MSKHTLSKKVGRDSQSPCRNAREGQGNVPEAQGLGPPGQDNADTTTAAGTDEVGDDNHMQRGHSSNQKEGDPRGLGQGLGNSCQTTKDYGCHSGAWNVENADILKTFHYQESMLSNITHVIS